MDDANKLGAILEHLGPAVVRLAAAKEGEEHRAAFDALRAEVEKLPPELHEALDALVKMSPGHVEQLGFLGGLFLDPAMTRGVQTVAGAIEALPNGPALPGLLDALTPKPQRAPGASEEVEANFGDADTDEENEAIWSMMDRDATPAQRAAGLLALDRLRRRGMFAWVEAINSPWGPAVGLVTLSDPQGRPVVLAPEAVRDFARELLALADAVERQARELAGQA